MPGHKDKKMMKKMPGGGYGMKKMPHGGKHEGMMGYGDGGMHHNPHGFGVENGGNSNFTNPPKGNSKETK
jgi:hypothetical protein